MERGDWRWGAEGGVKGVEVNGETGENIVRIDWLKLNALTRNVMKLKAKESLGDVTLVIKASEYLGDRGLNSFKVRIFKGSSTPSY